MRKQANIKANIAQPLAPAKQSEARIFNLPDSPASNFLYDVLAAGGDIADLPNRKRQVTHDITYEVLENGNKRLISSKSKTAAMTIELADIEKVMGSNKAAKKFLLLALAKINDQAMYNGKLTKEYISFPLQELVDLGFYSTSRSARTGFKASMNILSDIKMGGDIQITKKKKITVVGAHPFRKGIIYNSMCYIHLETDFDWEFLIQYFTILPFYYFNLSNKASDLLYCIFYFARQRTKEIKERGYFTINFRTLQQKLQLPSEKGLNNPQRDIKKAIKLAVEEVANEHSKAFGDTGLLLQLEYNDKAPISEYLDNGYLKVTLNGTFASPFIEISKGTEKQIEEAKQKKDRIQENAMAKALAKKLETDKGKDPTPVS